ncbi:polysaccharide biosynthesis/export family protein [Sinorhizobium americanum]|uniref:Polysaccharide export outer membrane protein/exopolysaccharide production protein ExoF n=1 Tax=Sinorhizobium americanum TaxID=194963 RepID=A0A4R2BW86_9HYPH|nr:polysaccharide biosynthesis/export family protein [Sinorhizobium americanum]APG88492.1 exopolysaccharide production protein ExoF2 [Sinorhizobium americanum CCGM7]TCN31265.1 polysaccharide export outer membrane protein/exopolysaccharide production protein ExoF [Sinorhizobium americanum]
MMPNPPRAPGSHKRSRNTLSPSHGQAFVPARVLSRRIRYFIGRFALSVGLSVFAVSGPTAANADDEYLLGPQDKVRIKIYEWRASRDAIFEWSALNDEFAVSAGGSLSLPFAGEIRAAGLTPKSLAYAIGDQLMRNMGLGRRPDAAVEVIQYRPFYIVGHVMQPGEFPYRPDLTVLQALSIAGGLRMREESIARFEREVIQGRGDVNLLALENTSLLARKARLEAELKNAENIQFPSSLITRQNDRAVALLMEQEQSIFRVRREGLQTQVRALENLHEFLEKELASLDAQLLFHDKQIRSIQKELTDVSSLVSKGLAAAPREMSLDRALTQYQSERLTAETSLLRARQEISRTEITILELRNRYTNEVTVTLRQTQAELDALSRKAETAIELLHESEISAPRLLALRAKAARAKPVYTIVRAANGRSEELPATESSIVRPGDTLKVEIPMLDLEDFEETSSGPVISGIATTSREPNVQGTLR